MINITITQKVVKQRPVQKNVLKTKTPTEIKRNVTDRYSGGSTSEEVQFAETYEVADMIEYETTTVTLLTQEITSDELFNLKDVVKAINGI
jgi:hypothetical protein